MQGSDATSSRAAARPSNPASALRVGGAPRLQPRSSRVVLQQPPEATDGDDEPEPYRAERPTV